MNAVVPGDSYAGSCADTQMARKSTPNDLYWTTKENAELCDRYKTFCAENILPCNPHNAHLFAMHERKAGLSRLSERDIILAVEGQLPELFD